MLDVALFRQLFPAFANPATYSDALIQFQWDVAGGYVSTCEKMIYYMTAHLMALSDLIASGQTPGMVSSSTVGSVSVSLTPPPVKSQLNWWLSLTPYGQQLLAMAQALTAGGLYIGGKPETGGFRDIGGGF